jgi:ABC-type glycerol-3-phosphate transport system permease component
MNKINKHNDGTISRKRRKKAYKNLRRFLLYILIIVLLGTLSFPIFWMVSTSIKTNEEVITVPPTFIPLNPTLVNFIRLWTEQTILRYFLNSLIVAISTTICATLVSAMAGYVFSRFKSWWSGLGMVTILFSQMLPIVLLLIGIFTIMKQVRLLNTYYALIISYTILILPFCVWMLKNFFDTIPTEIDEAAMIDGCSHFQIFTRIILPLARPGLTATMIFAFIVAWNDYLIALTLTSTDSMRTLPVAITRFIGQYATRWNRLMAASLIVSIPVIAIFIILQRSFVEGLTKGSVKG